ncbi:hypothetical protein HDA32_003608 [Spinactinospora alkalitolerans]|uniref:DUF1468 domain-containing protein n=1 Tax=Spinactinospora alkalitolerans TaxID=687207 RepID=A0A852TX19_9ACTN|nr:tripartite tricarboxylate transporter TctB family protein [Spinactinospora alkalitolerans]NYE48488.1 hypothetical protein [Spinactinospora alkalitolerans]
MSARTPADGTDECAPSRAAGDLALGTALIVVCAWAAGESLDMPRRGELGLLTSPGFTPFLVCVLVAVLSAVVVARALMRGALKGIAPRIAEMWCSEESRRVVVLFALITGYALLIGVVQFAVVTGGFLLAMFWYVRSGGWLTIALATAVGVLLTAVVIPYAFTMPLP